MGGRGRKSRFIVDDRFQLGFLCPQRIIGEQLLFFHDITLIRILVGIMVVVIGIRLSLFLVIESNGKLNQSINMEILWILIPIVILIIIGTPSIKILYQIEETFAITKNIYKVTGYQWYWTYESSNISTTLGDGELMESYMGRKDLENDRLNNLRARLELECWRISPNRFIITSSDVIHRWALPSIFLKVDAIPGRLNQIETIFPPTTGRFYGQCSELCGVNHRFMPIVLNLLL